MKKSFVLFSALLALSQTAENNAVSSRKQKDMITSLASATYTEGFGAQTDKSKQISQNVINNMQKIVKETKKFVENSFGWYERLFEQKNCLITSIQGIEEATNKLIDTVKLSRESNDPIELSKLEKEFIGLEAQLKQIENKLDRKIYISETKNSARDILKKLTGHMINAIQDSLTFQNERIAGKKTPSA